MSLNLTNLCDICGDFADMNISKKIKTLAGIEVELKFSRNGGSVDFCRVCEAYALTVASEMIGDPHRAPPPQESGESVKALSPPKNSEQNKDKS